MTTTKQKYLNALAELKECEERLKAVRAEGNKNWATWTSTIRLGNLVCLSTSRHGYLYIGLFNNLAYGDMFLIECEPENHSIQIVSRFNCLNFVVRLGGEND